jgi:hypothetical protein
MKLTSKQIDATKKALSNKGILPAHLDNLSTFADFDHWWTMQFGYKNNLAAFLRTLEK